MSFRTQRQRSEEFTRVIRGRPCVQRGCRFFVAALLKITMALRRPHKGMKVWAPRRSGVDWNPRAWGLDTGPVSEYGAGFSPV